MQKKFIIPFETGIVVIKHWKIHNYIRNDRYKETQCKYEKSILSLDETNAYILGIPDDNRMDTVGIPNGDKMDTQDSIGKDSIGKDNTMCNAHVQNVQKDVQSDVQCTVENGVTEINSLFESLWELYPNKKGKGRISKAKKKEIYNIGFDEFKRCIDRYVNDLKKDSWRKPQNGNTFFNSGYIDYLDKNYVEDERTVINDKYGDIGTIL